MIDKIKEGYTLFIRKNENNDLIGSLSIKEEDNYKDIIQLNLEEMSFLKDYHTIYSQIDLNCALFVKYQYDNKEFFVSIQKKQTTGEYNDKAIWNDLIVSTKKDLFEALHRLEEKIQTKLERSYL